MILDLSLPQSYRSKITLDQHLGVTIEDHVPEDTSGTWKTPLLPAVPVHNLVERSPVGPDQRTQRPVGGIAQTDQEEAQVAVRKAEHALRLRLIGDS